MTPFSGTFRLPVRQFLLAFACALLAAACASPPPKPVITKVEGKVAASDKVNPDSKGRPSPVVLRLYELKSLAAFSSADFFSLWENDQAALGAELAAREEIHLKPGEQVDFSRTVQPGVTHLGAVVAYRDLEHAVWRGMVPLPLGKTTPVTLTVGPRTLTLAPQ